MAMKYDVDDLDEFRWEFYQDLATELDAAADREYPAADEVVWNEVSTFEQMLVRQHDPAFAEDLDAYAEAVEEYRAYQDPAKTHLGPLYEELPDHIKKEDEDDVYIFDEDGNTKYLWRVVGKMEDLVAAADGRGAFEGGLDGDVLGRYRNLLEEIEDPEATFWRGLNAGDPSLWQAIRTSEEKKLMLQADIEHGAEELLDRLEERVAEDIVDGDRSG